MRYRAPIIALIAALVLSAGFYFLLWRPKDDELEVVRAETAELESQRSQLQNELRRLEEIEERQVEFRAALSKLEEYIPNGPTQAEVIRQFQLAADASGVDIASVQFSEPVAVPEAPPTGTPDTVLGEIDVSMVVEGGYFQTVDFFRRLEVDVPRAVLMQSFGMSEGQNGFPVLATTWTASLFTVMPDLLPEPEPDADPDAEADADAELEADEDADPDADPDVEADVDVEIQAQTEGEEQS